MAFSQTVVQRSNINSAVNIVCKFKCYIWKSKLVLSECNDLYFIGIAFIALTLHEIKQHPVFFGTHIGSLHDVTKLICRPRNAHTWLVDILKCKARLNVLSIKNSGRSIPDSTAIIFKPKKWRSNASPLHVWNKERMKVCFSPYCAHSSISLIVHSFPTFFYSSFPFLIFPWTLKKLN